MSNLIDTFKRYEKKYLIDKALFNNFINDITDYIKKDEFYQYTIKNIYYDTDNFEIIRKSLEKPVYKEKLRVRTYDSANSKDEVFIELKKKYKKQVYKRRISITNEAFEYYIKNNIVNNVSKQVLSEIEYFKRMYDARPKVFIAYDRYAYKGREDGNIRITCDEKIRFRTDDLLLLDDDTGKEILQSNKCIVEIKVLGAMPIWLSSALNKHKIYPTSFSKYGYCYTNYILKTTA